MSEEFENDESLEFTVGSVKSGGSGGGSYKPLDEDEVYDAKLVSVKKENMPFGPALKWLFELQGKEFSYEYEGNQVQRRVQGTSSLSCTPRSKLYAWYCKLIGEELAEGSAISIAKIEGKSCRLLIANTKSKKADDEGNFRIYSNVSKILASKDVGKVAPEKPAPTEPQEAPKEKKVEKPAEKKASAVEPPKESASDDDVFSDIF